MLRIKNKLSHGHSISSLFPPKCCSDVVVLPQLWLSLPHFLCLTVTAHHHYVTFITLAAICLNSTVIVPLYDCNTTIQLPSRFYRRLLYDCSTVPLQLLQQEYKCCMVCHLTTNVLNILKLSSLYKAAWWGLRGDDERRQWCCNDRWICHFPFIVLITMTSSSSVKGALGRHLLRQDIVAGTDVTLGCFK